ncbi:MAG: hypothetical protein QF463_00560 [Vicinamibacterales bacterium]|nr:hypothetical protein [Vicinamibacterales bacterium]MDP6607543.1 hypothetical protein [Vicinamibacterales bacterium]
MAHTLGLDRLERHPGRTIVAVGVLFAVAYVSAVTLFPRAHGRIIDGDGIQYYAYLRSLVFDRDVNFVNDYELLYGADTDNVWLTNRTVTGYAVNQMSIGPALLWLPVFLLTCGLVAAGTLLGSSVPVDGFAAPFQLSAGLAGIVYSTAGVYLLYRICAREFAPRPALWASLVAWLASPAIYYSLVSPTYSHALSMFTVALFVDVWRRTRGESGPRRYVVLGLLAGLAALVRWQDVIIMLLPVGEAVAKRPTRVTQAVGRLALMGGVSAVAFAPQMMAWRAMYGRFVLTPQGSDFMRWTEPQIAAVLWSWNHGLFSWTPALLLAVGGLYWLHRHDRLLGWGSAVVVLIAVYINASVVDWWGGEAFGARRFVSYTVFFALGLTAIASTERLRRQAYAVRLVAAFLIASNVLFLAQYQIAMRSGGEIVEYPVTARQVLWERFALPWRLVGRQALE